MNSKNLHCTTLPTKGKAELLPGEIDGLSVYAYVLLPEESAVSELAAKSSKVFIKLKSGSAFSDGFISADEIKELCYRSGKELITSDDLISHFEYVRYKTGKGEEMCLSFPSLRYIKAKLEALCELGFMGMACDIDSVPIRADRPRHC